MKLVAVAPFLGLASAAFEYSVSSADSDCKGCSSLVNPDAAAVSECLATLDPDCEWTVAAIWDGEALQPLDEACHTLKTQILGLPEALDHGLTFPEGADVLIGLLASDFMVEFETAAKKCTLDAYAALLARGPDSPDCSADLNGWTKFDLTLETDDAAASFSWKPELKEVANYVRFEPQADCWTEETTDFLKATTTSVGSYRIFAQHQVTPVTSTEPSAPTESSSENTASTESVRPLIASLGAVVGAGYLFF